MEDDVLIEPVQVPDYLDEYITLKSPSSDDVLEQTESNYYETIIANQEILISNQEAILQSNAEVLNACLGIDNLLFLLIIVFFGFWIAKNVFMKFF